MQNIIDSIRRHSDVIAIAILVLTALTTFLLFNVRMSEGGDDSGYICRALDLLQSGRYPNYQGPLYPIILSVFIAIAGSVKVVMLKVTSLVFLVGGQALFYFGLRRSTSRLLLLAVMLLLALNAWFVEFGSLTYSEALFSLVMWAAIFAALKVDSAESRRQQIVWAVVCGLLITLCFLIRTVGFGLAISVVAYLLLQKRYVQTLSVFAGCALSLVLWYGVRAVVWGNVSDRGQMDSLLQVDPYDASQGQETVKGFAKRFIGNSDLYLSKHLVKMLGFREKDSRDKSRALSIILIALYCWGSFCAFKRGGGILLLALTGMVMFGITFFALQVMWDQYRLVVPYIGMAYAVLLYGVYCLLRLLLKISTAQSIMLVLVTILAFTSAKQVAARTDLLTLRKNLRGDDLYGYTPDFYNYLSLCREVGEKLQTEEPNCYVACRKPEMARIYSGGKKFHGIYNIPSDDPDVLVERLRSAGVTHIIVASLRRDPLMPGAGVINTVHRYLKVILDKYPNFLTDQKITGNPNVEPAYLFRIQYPQQNTSE